MNIVLTPELESFITRQVQTGRYVDESEVVRDAVRSLARLDREDDAELEAALLDGVRAPHRAYDETVLESIRQRGSQIAASA